MPMERWDIQSVDTLTGFLVSLQNCEFTGHEKVCGV